MKNITLSETYITVGRQRYSNKRIKNIWLKELSLKSHLIRGIALMLQYSSVGWLTASWVWVPSISIPLILILSLIGLFHFSVSFRRYELKALLSAIDETGEQPITLAAAVKTDNYQKLKMIETQWREKER